MNILKNEKRVAVVKALVDGASIRATVRMTGVAKATVLKLLADLGRACQAFQDRHLRNLPCRRIQTDEIWSFCYAKAKNVPEGKRDVFGYGDVWTWTAICADTKLAVAWRVGTRDSSTGIPFMRDVAGRLLYRVQLTSDAHKAYLEAVEQAFGGEVHYAQLVKVFSAAVPGPARYSPPACVGVQKTTVVGMPDPKHVSTSFVERQNLTMRMGMRRFTRLTNGFSKKVENHACAVALHFMYYNFARVHQSLRSTPAMRAKVTDHLWDVEEIVGLLDLYGSN